MVQKSFLSLISHDIKKNPANYNPKLINSLNDIEKSSGTEAEKTIKVQGFLLKEMGRDWVEKCERGLYLSKRLGNIYTGSLYNGLLSLICDQSISLEGKTILMFSYGSGCAASMFVLRVTGDYTNI